MPLEQARNQVTHKLIRGLERAEEVIERVARGVIDGTPVQLELTACNLNARAACTNWKGGRCTMTTADTCSTR